MMYYVFYAGVGSDGGFGDYAPPYFSDTPVKVQGQVMWVRTEEEAKRLNETLNELARDAFYSHGVHAQYDGNFPLEYEYRAMFVPDSEPVSVPEAVAYMREEYTEAWKTVSTYNDDDWYDDEDDGPDEAPNLQAAAEKPRQFVRE